MFKKALFLSILLPYILLAEADFRVENTNFTISDDSVVYNYDRVRFRTDYKEGSYFGTFIGDIVNYYGNEFVNSEEFSFFKQVESDTGFSTQTNFKEYKNGSVYAKIYRLYGGYEDEQNRVSAGLLNVPMGVGRIWTPTNIFNPKNIYAMEPDEVFGVAGVLYTRYIDETSHLSAVVSKKADGSFKYAGIYKTFIGLAEVGADVVISDDTKMIGYEIESNLYDTGVEVRSEGAYIKSRLKNSLDYSGDEEFFQGILGADYGFVNGVTLGVEALYSSKKFLYQDIVLNIEAEIAQNLVGSSFYSAISLSYAFNIFLDASFVYIESFNDKNSRFISPSLTYTLNDYNTFMLGAMIYDGASGSEFAHLNNSYYFRWSLSF